MEGAEEPDPVPADGTRLGTVAGTCYHCNKKILHCITTLQKLHAVEKRRLEAELTRTRQGLLKSEELLNNKERLMSPTM